VLVTSFAIPHFGGASVHFELLERQLRGRALLAATITGSMAPAWLGTRAAAALARRAGWEWPRAELLRRTVTKLSGLLKSAALPPGTVFHCQDPLASCAALKVARHGDTVVQTVHGPLSREVVDAGYRAGGAVERTLNALERTAFSGVDLLLPVDEGQAAVLEGAFGVPKERVRVIRNAVDADEVARAGESPAPAARCDTFLVPRRLVRKNGVAFAIRALARPEAAAFRLLIAGDGPERRGLRALARASGVAERVRFYGPVPRDRLLSMMKAAAGVIVPSVPSGGVVEATSLAVLEAMASGVPLIASDIGGIAEIVSSADLGYLVRAGEPAEIARAMTCVHGLDERERARRIEAAREHVKNEFGVAGWMAAILAAYGAARARSAR
jgi:glycosyltransferase involved in cell wall biosynthesis